MNKRWALLAFTLIIITLNMGMVSAAYQAFYNGFEDATEATVDGFNNTVWDNTEIGSGNDLMVSTAHVRQGSYSVNIQEGDVGEAAVSINASFLDLSTYSGCVLTYWFYVGGNQGTSDHLYVDIYDGSWTYGVEDLIGEDYDSGDAAWRQRTVLLSSYSMVDGFRVRFDSEANLDNKDYWIDDINISCDVYGTAPIVSNVTGSPTTIKGGDTLTIHANTSSNGLNDTEGDTLYLYCDTSELPTAANTDCTGGVTSGGYEYNLTCTFPVASDSTEHTEYCRIYDGYFYSDVMNITYTTDSAIPSTSIVSVADDTAASYFDTENDGQTDINISGEASMNCRWSASDVDYSSMSNACTIEGIYANCSISDASSEGFHTRYVSCQDSLGNEQNSSNNLNVQFYLDYTVPTTSDDSVVSIQAPSYIINISEADNVDGDPTTYYCTDTDNTCEPTTSIDDNGQITFTSSNRGTNYFRYYSVDDAGNIQSNQSSTIKINQLPNFTSTTDDATTIAGGTTVNVSTISNDSDLQEIILYVCNASGATSAGCTEGHYCNSTGDTENVSCTFTSESDSASHTWYSYIFDESNEEASNNPLTGSYTTDTTGPTITVNSPTNGTTYTQNSLTFAIIVDEALSWAGYSINGTNNISMSNTSTFEWTNSNNSIEDGTYIVTLYANDTYNNLASSSIIEFTIDSTAEDTTSPTITVWEPSNGSYYTSASTMINISTNENASWAGYILNDGSLTDLDNSSETAWNMSETLVEGQNNITLYANDTRSAPQNQGNISIIAYIDLNDPVISGLSCASPINDSLDVNCDINFTDTYSLDYAIIEHNATGTLSNSSQQDISGIAYNLSYTISPDNTTPSIFNSTVYAYDSSGRMVASSVEINVTDDTFPEVYNISYSPNTTDELDPNVIVNVTADITEDTEIGSVYLMWQESVEGVWNSTAMDASGITYNASFTPYNGTWLFQINVTDSAGNENVSINTSVVVENDISANVSTTVNTIEAYTVAQENDNETVGYLVINNTGDTLTNFTINISSPDLEDRIDLNQTAGISAVYEVTSADELNLSVIFNTTGLAGGLYPYNISVTYNPTIVFERWLTIQSEVGPYMYVTIDDYNATADPGDEMNLTATVQNLGTADATGVWLNWTTLPSDWTIDVGSQNRSIGNLAVDTSAANTITVTLGESEGTKTITASAASDENSSDSDSKSIVVGNTEITIIEGGSSSSSTSGGSSSSGGGSEYIETSTVLEVVRGTEEYFPINVTNIYPNSTLENVTINIDGFFSQYITFGPTSLSGIEYGESQIFTLIINAPSYLEFDNYTIKSSLTGSIVYGDISKSLIDRRTILLLIQEVSKDSVLLCYNTSVNDIEDMKAANFTTKKIERLLSDLDNAIVTNNNGLASELCSEIHEKRTLAFASNQLILNVKEGINEADKRKLDVPETKELYNLALAAFGREDYPTAQQRSKDALLTLLLETKGRVNLLWFIMTYWWAIILFLIALVLGAYLIYKKLASMWVTQKIRNLDKEEEAIKKLIRAAQKDTYDKKIMSTSEYEKNMIQYNARLVTIKHLRIKLRHRRSALLLSEERVKDMEKEEAGVKSLIKKVQKKYFEKGTISRHKYLEEIASDRERLAEIEEERATLETGLLKEKSTIKYKLLSVLSKFMGSKQTKVKHPVKEKEEDKKEEVVKKKPKSKKKIIPKRIRAMFESKGKKHERRTKDMEKQGFKVKALPKKELKLKKRQNPKRDKWVKSLEEYGFKVKK